MSKDSASNVVDIEQKIEELQRAAAVDIESYKQLFKEEQLHFTQEYSKKRIYRSSIFAKKLADLQQDYTIMVEKRKEKLQQEIQKLKGTEESYIPNFPEGYTPPYPVDMRLSLRERYYAVCDHYLTYPSKAVALAEIDNDIFIDEYLQDYLPYLRNFVVLKLP